MLTRRSFFDAEEFAFSASLSRSWTALREEARAVLERFLYLQFAHPELYRTRNPGVVGDRGMFYLVMAGMPVGLNLARCPHTAEALKAIPRLWNAAFYLLGPQAHILPHTGLCDRVLRAHLGLICPPDCALRIGSEQQAWREGALMVFDDTLEHEAWNRSDRWRAVLSFDFFHPEDAELSVRRALSAFALGQKPMEHAWYAAADLQVPSEFSWPPTRSPGIDAQVAEHGLYFC